MLRLGMRDAGQMHEIFVIEKLVALRRHEVPIEPEELSVELGVVHLHRLEWRVEVLELAPRPNEDAAVFAQIFRHQARREVRARRIRLAAAAVVRHRGPRDELTGSTTAGAAEHSPCCETAA